jgi:hypothetical protein
MPKKMGKALDPSIIYMGRNFKISGSIPLKGGHGVATVRKRSCVGAAATNERNGGWGRGEDLLTIVALIPFTIQTHKGK